MTDTHVRFDPSKHGWGWEILALQSYADVRSDIQPAIDKLFPHPPLAFCVEGNHSLSVRALFDNQRPGRTCATAVAPYWNTSAEGEVCLGPMPTPRSAGLDGLDQWVQGFFGSEFTHPNATKLTNHPEGHLGLWRDLKGRDHLPAEWLVPAGNLEQWLCRNK